MRSYEVENEEEEVSHLREDLFRTYADDPDAHRRVSFIENLFAET